jgi:hypothetical protein
LGNHDQGYIVVIYAENRSFDDPTVSSRARTDFNVSPRPDALDLAFPKRSDDCASAAIKRPRK